MADGWRPLDLKPEQVAKVENNDDLVLDSDEGMRDRDGAVWALCWVRIEKGEPCICEGFYQPVHCPKHGPSLIDRRVLPDE